MLARAQIVDRLLLEWHTKQALKFENKNKQFTQEEIFEDDQMVYLLAPHSSKLQTNTTKFKQDFIGPLFIDTALNKTHYRLKDITGLLLDGMYHVSQIKRGSVCTPQGIVNTFDGYEKALKNTLLNKLAIESPNHTFEDVTLKDGRQGLTYCPGTIMDYAPSMAWCSLKSKYYPAQRINYRTEDDIINEPLSCMALICTKYKTEKDG